MMSQCSPGLPFNVTAVGLVKHMILIVNSFLSLLILLYTVCPLWQDLVP